MIGPIWSSTAIGAIASVAAMTRTVTVADAVPPRPSSMEYVNATAAEPSAPGVIVAGGVNVTAPPPSAIAVSPAEGTPAWVTRMRSPSGSESLVEHVEHERGAAGDGLTTSSNASGRGWRRTAA